MVSEETLRRPGFCGGMSVVLADGQPWIFPVPRREADGSDTASCLDLQQLELITCIAEAECRAERLLAELALAIELLSRNYRLLPEDYRVLFDFPPESPELFASQRAFRELACLVARQYDGGGDVPDAQSERASSCGSGGLGRLASRLRAGLSGLPFGSWAGLVGAERRP